VYLERSLADRLDRTTVRRVYEWLDLGDKTRLHSSSATLPEREAVLASVLLPVDSL
jgi:hypothetical protein